MGKFSEFLKENNDNNTIESCCEQNINELIDKYSTYSESDLMREFLLESEKKKENGELNSDALNKIKNLLTPYLNEDQVNRLKELLDMVK